MVGVESRMGCVYSKMPVVVSLRMRVRLLMIMVGMCSYD